MKLTDIGISTRNSFLLTDKKHINHCPTQKRRKRNSGRKPAQFLKLRKGGCPHLPDGVRVKEAEENRNLCKMDKLWRQKSQVIHMIEGV